MSWLEEYPSPVDERFVVLRESEGSVERRGERKGLELTSPSFASQLDVLCKGAQKYRRASRVGLS